MAPARDRATGPRSRSPGGGTASSTRRATARRWRACCRGSSADRPEIVVVCSCPEDIRASSATASSGRCVLLRDTVPDQGEGRSAVGTDQGVARPGRFKCHGDTRPRDMGAAPQFLFGTGIGGAARCWLRPRRPAASYFGLKFVFANGFSVRAGDFYLKPPATNMLHSGECVSPTHIWWMTG
jgi:hypothetical protein